MKADLGLQDKQPLSTWPAQQAASVVATPINMFGVKISTLHLLSLPLNSICQDQDGFLHLQLEGAGSGGGSIVYS